MRLHHLALAALAASSLMIAPERADACGGCFAPIPPPETGKVPPLVTAHRMALSISTDQTVLWDQIRYSGEPSEFAWVLPIKPGARVELASDAFFDVLDAATTAVVLPPDLECDGTGQEGSCGVVAINASTGLGCGDGGEGIGDGGVGDPPDDGVEIISHGSAGPYETVILRGEDPASLTNWLEDHDYPIAEDIFPVIGAYVDEGFDFVALRLLPGAGIQQMRPVRVVQPGAVPTLPLRMVAAGSGARTAISLFVIGEGRYTTGNFKEVAVDRSRLEYDFATLLSNYTTLRDEVFEQNAQQTFLATYSRRGALFRETRHPVNDFPVFYRTTDTTTSGGYTRMADAYVQQAFLNAETTSTDCAAAFDNLENDARRVVDLCDEEGNCREVDPLSEIDASTLSCPPPIGSDLPLSDLSVALVGMHPSDVWVTRLDANLGRSAFGRDLELVAAPMQYERPSFITATVAIDAPCATVSTIAKSGGMNHRQRARMGVAAVFLMTLCGALVRRAARASKKAVKS